MCIKSIFLVSILSLLSCKASNEVNASNGNSYTSSMFVNDEGQVDFRPIMGEPTDITIKFTDYNGGGTIKIVGFYSDQNYLADTTACVNGVVHYKNDKGLAQGLYYFSIPGKQDYVQVFVGEDQKFEIETTTTDLINGTKITGSEENSLFYENMKFESILSPKINSVNAIMKNYQEGSDDYNKYKSQRDELDKERIANIDELTKKHTNNLFVKFKSGGQNPKIHDELAKEQQVVEYRKEFWDNVDFSDDRLLRTPMIGNKLKRYFKELTPQNPDSIFASAKLLLSKVPEKSEYFKVFANWVVLTYEPTKCDLMDAEAVFVNMVQNYFTKEKAFWQDSLMTPVIQKRAFEMAQSLVGKPAPNVISTDQYGKTQELLSKTADYLIVYMFNPECEHCQEETPKLFDFYNKNKGLVDVFAIAIETDEQKWKNYIQKNGLTWTTVFDPTNRSIYAKYFVDITPEMYVINKERKIIGKNLKTFQIQTIIDRDKASKK